MTPPQTLEQTIQAIPLESSLKAEVLRRLPTLTADDKYELTRLLAETYSGLLEVRVGELVAIEQMSDLMLRRPRRHNIASEVAGRAESDLRVYPEKASKDVIRSSEQWIKRVLRMQ